MQKCKICGINVTQLSRHMITHMDYEAKPIKCHKCGRTFSSSRGLKKHMFNRFDCVKQFKCDECDKSFSSEKYLKDHKYVHKEEFRFSCEKCGAKFKTLQTFHDHRKKCKATFISTERAEEKEDEDQEEDNQDSLSEEESIEIEEVEMDSAFSNSAVDFKIPDVPENKNQKAQEELPNSPKEKNRKRKRKNIPRKSRNFQEEKQSMKTNLTKFKCEKCGAVFANKYNFIRHINRAFPCDYVKKFQCDECEKSFSSEQYLKDHKYVHKDEFRFSCEKCGAKFKTLQTFHDHRKKCKATFISTERAEEKEDGDREEDNQDSLSEEESIEIEEVEMDSAFSDSAVDFKIPDVPENKNQKAKEELPNTPKEKNRKRKRRNNLRKSINSNEEKQSMKNNLTQFECEKCGAVFAHKCSLKRHINKAFPCDYVKQFKCDECEKSFSSERYLKDHKYVHKEEFRFSCEICGAKFKQNYILHDHRRRCKATLISTEKDTEIDADDQIEDNKDFFSEEESIEIVEVEMDSDFVDSGVEFKIPDIPEKKNRKAQKELP
ncbi:unnamed protein product, partial [Oikopleura dioica]